MESGPELALLLGAVVGGSGLTGRHRLRRTGPAVPENEEGGDDGDDDQSEDPRPGASASALGELLRHEPTLPHGALADHPGWLSWISYNRVWFVPYASALFVVLLEVGVGLFSATPLPAPAHITLVWFGLFAVGRGQRNQQRMARRRAEIRTVAQALGVPETALQDEFAEFMAHRAIAERSDDV